MAVAKLFCVVLEDVTGRILVWVNCWLDIADFTVIVHASCITRGLRKKRHDTAENHHYLPLTYIGVSPALQETLSVKHNSRIRPKPKVFLFLKQMDVLFHCKNITHTMWVTHYFNCEFFSFIIDPDASLSTKILHGKKERSMKSVDVRRIFPSGDSVLLCFYV